MAAAELLVAFHIAGVKQIRDNPARTIAALLRLLEQNFPIIPSEVNFFEITFSILPIIIFWKPLIYYAALKNHIGIYFVLEADGNLTEEIKKYQIKE